jgi:hypothetical protein
MLKTEILYSRTMILFQLGTPATLIKNGDLHAGIRNIFNWTGYRDSLWQKADEAAQQQCHKYLPNLWPEWHPGGQSLRLH